MLENRAASLIEEETQSASIEVVDLASLGQTSDSLMTVAGERFGLTETELAAMVVEFSKPEIFETLRANLAERAGEIKQVLAELVGKVSPAAKEALFFLTGALELILAIIALPFKLLFGRYGKTVVTLLVTMAILIGCIARPATATSPPNTATPTIVTVTPTPTYANPPTRIPTKISPTMIPATPTEKSYYPAASENVFPTPEGSQVVEFICTADFSKIIYQSHTLPDGTIVKAWVTCEDGGTEFLLPLFFENDQMSFSPLNINAVSKNGKAYNISDAAMRKKIESGLVGWGTGQRVKVKVIIGAESSSRLIGPADPFPGIFATTGFDEATKEFGATGDPNKLPTLPNLPGRVLLVLRISQFIGKPTN